MDRRDNDAAALLLLVGSNPLPNYLASLIFRPHAVWLFYTPQTAPIKDHLVERMKERSPGLAVTEKCIDDATDAAKVREAFGAVPQGAHLHYTGGTKIMAAHARMAFAAANGSDRQASYLDERRGVLRYDDGYEIQLSRQSLTLELHDILRLHGIETLPEKTASQPAPCPGDAEAVARAVLNQPGLAGELYALHREEGRRKSVSQAKQAPVSLAHVVGAGLSAAHLPEPDWSRNTYETWCEFLGGGWLEMWCARVLAPLTSGDQVLRGVNCRLANGRAFEIDVAFVRGHRFFVMSCTTDRTLALCKSKLFEVAMRARQLGGDLARSALVCLLHGSDKAGPYMDQLRNDVADVWDAPNTPRVFGLDDLREWAGIGGAPNTASLVDWLES